MSHLATERFHTLLITTHLQYCSLFWRATFKPQNHIYIYISVLYIYFLNQKQVDFIPCDAEKCIGILSQVNFIVNVIKYDYE